MDHITFFISAQFAGVGPCCNCNQEDIVHTGSDGHQYCIPCTDTMIINEAAVWGGEPDIRDCSHKRERRRNIGNTEVHARRIRMAS